MQKTSFLQHKTTLSWSTFLHLINLQDRNSVNSLRRMRVVFYLITIELQRTLLNYKQMTHLITELHPWTHLSAVHVECDIEVALSSRVKCELAGRSPQWMRQLLLKWISMRENDALQVLSLHDIYITSKTYSPPLKILSPRQ